VSAPQLTPLIEKHFGELHFDLRLRHKETGKFVGIAGLVDYPEALVFDSNPHGMTPRELYLWFAEDSGANWLLTAHAVQEFEVVSELGEM
jgi:hypothetical protein